MNRKGQAAFEFLATYGWAFIAISVAIGALVYFGLSSPEKVLPNRCNFGPEFQCLDSLISASNNEFRLKIRNAAGFPVTITSINLSSESATQYSCAAPLILPISNMPSGSTADLTFSSCNSQAAGFSTGSRRKVFVTIKNYDSRSEASYTRQVKGEVYSTVD